jgi:hypothetical protein
MSSRNTQLLKGESCDSLNIFGCPTQKNITKPWIFSAHKVSIKVEMIKKLSSRKFGSEDSTFMFILTDVFVIRVVYFSLHRFEYGSFWPNLRESDFHYVGEGPGLGCNFNVPLNNVGMTDADYLAVFHQVLLPMASEVHFC